MRDFKMEDRTDKSICLTVTKECTVI